MVSHGWRDAVVCCHIGSLSRREGRHLSTPAQEPVTAEERANLPARRRMPSRRRPRTPPPARRDETGNPRLTTPRAGALRWAGGAAYIGRQIVGRQSKFGVVQPGGVMTERPQSERPTSERPTSERPTSGAEGRYVPERPVRFVTAASLFDGHDASINIMRRILQSQG